MSLNFLDMHYAQGITARRNAIGSVNLVRQFRSTYPLHEIHGQKYQQQGNLAMDPTGSSALPSGYHRGPLQVRKHLQRNQVKWSFFHV